MEEQGLDMPWKDWVIASWEQVPDCLRELDCSVPGVRLCS